MEPEMKPQARRSWSESTSNDDPSLRINKTGTGVNLNWKALVGIVGAAVGVTISYMNIQATSAAHTATLAEHSVSLHELKNDFRNVNVKVDALVIDRGINPHQVLKDAGSTPPAH